MSFQCRCPECNLRLAINTRHCSCGWGEKLKAPRTGDYTVDYHLCQYTFQGRRCPLVGTNSPSPYGQGHWYCCEHSRNLGDLLICESILINAEKNYETMSEARIDWRRKLFAEDFKIMKVNLKNEEKEKI